MPVGTLKITALLIRTITKPIAGAIKNQAKNHPKFRRTCIGFAQWIHRTDFHLRMYLLGEQSAARIRPLNDARAIENGANILSEAIIFSVAGGIIVYEGLRSSASESQRREKVADDIATLQDEIEVLKTSLRKYGIGIEERQSDNASSSSNTLGSSDSSNPSLSSNLSPSISLPAQQNSRS